MSIFGDLAKWVENVLKRRCTMLFFAKHPPPLPPTHLNRGGLRVEGVFFFSGAQCEFTAFLNKTTGTSRTTTYAGVVAFFYADLVRFAGKSTKK